MIKIKYGLKIPVVAPAQSEMFYHTMTIMNTQFWSCWQTAMQLKNPIKRVITLKVLGEAILLVLVSIQLWKMRENS